MSKATIKTSLRTSADLVGSTLNLAIKTPSVLKAVLKTPFAAGKGYLMEAEGLTPQEAELIAYKYLNQDITDTIEQVGEGAGKLLANLFTEAADEVGKASKVTL